MLIKEWQPEDEVSWEFKHGQILSFIHKYAHRRISTHCYKQLMRLSRRKLLAPDSSLLLAYVRTEDGPLLAGLSCLTNQGRGVGVVVVHPLYRNQRIGSLLLSRQLARLGEITCLVATDNPAGLQMCLNAGLTVSRIMTADSQRTFLECCGRSATNEDLANPDKVGD